MVGPFLNGDLLQFDGAAWRPLGTGILSRVMLPFRGALADKATNQSVTNAGAAISWTSATYNTDAFWSGAAPTRLTIPAGVTRVQLMASIVVSGATTGQAAHFRKNGSAAFAGNASGYNFSAGAGAMIVSPVLAVVAGDYFEVFFTPDATRDVLGGTGRRSCFAVAVIETADAANPTLLALTDTPASYVGAAGKLLQVNGAATAIEFGLRHNLAASTAPAATDDSAAGYSVGSQWLDTVGDKIWFCIDATTGAAVWKGVTIA